jgi:hypothetical protein
LIAECDGCTELGVEEMTGIRPMGYLGNVQSGTSEIRRAILQKWQDLSG